METPIEIKVGDEVKLKPSNELLKIFIDNNLFKGKANTGNAFELSNKIGMVSKAEESYNLGYFFFKCNVGEFSLPITAISSINPSIETPVKTAEEIKTYEIFTNEFSQIVQARNIQNAIEIFYIQNPQPECEILSIMPADSWFSKKRNAIIEDLESLKYSFDELSENHYDYGGVKDLAISNTYMDCKKMIEEIILKHKP